MPMRLPEIPCSTAQDRADCRGLIRNGSKSFFAASLLLPKAVRDPSYIVYAFCRLADDHIDLETDQASALVRLRQRLDAVYSGNPQNVFADRALADVVRAYDIPRDLFDALLEGFEWDVENRRYRTLEDLQAYAARVAGTVGAVMTVLMGRRAEETLARACDLGVAMQLTNIARDVGEDAFAGRLYLPVDWMIEEGIDPDDFLAAPVYNDALGRVVARLLEAAGSLYQRAASGIADLPVACRPAINTARHLYADIGGEVTRNGFDSISQRAVVSNSRKLSLLFQSGIEAFIVRKSRPYPPLAQTAFLVRAASRDPAPAVADDKPTHGVPKAVDHRVGWMLDLFMELDKRDRLDTGFASPAGPGGGD